MPGHSSCRTTRSCRHKALLSSSGPDSIEKDLAGPEARLTLVERFPAERRGCVAPPEREVELPLPILRYPSHKSCRPLGAWEGCQGVWSREFFSSSSSARILIYVRARAEPSSEIPLPSEPKPSLARKSNLLSSPSRAWLGF